MKTVAEAIALVRTRANGRTRWAGQESFVDELLVMEIDRLAAELDRLRAVIGTTADGVLLCDAKELRCLECGFETMPAMASSTQAWCINCGKYQYKISCYSTHAAWEAAQAKKNQ